MKNIKIGAKTFKGVNAANLFDEDKQKLVKYVDTSEDTVSSQNLLCGETAHNAEGKLIVGEYKPRAFSRTLVGDTFEDIPDFMTVVVSRVKLDGGTTVEVVDPKT